MYNVGMSLETKTINSIELKAEDELKFVFGNDIPLPVDLGKIAQAHGVELKRVKFADENALGQLDRPKKTIYVAQGISFPRVAFTVAHELGHFILHDAEKTTFWRTNELNLEKQDKAEEQEANWFASSLLMPKNEVLRFWSKTHDISLLSTIFGVSNSAMGFRLKNLGLVDYA